MLKTTSFLLLLALAVLSSCSSVYMPNVPNTPMLTQAGEFSGAAHLSLKGNISLNTAYAFDDHFSLMLNGAVAHRDREKKDFKQGLLEAGIGYYDTFGPSNNRIFEIYAGFGKGNSLKVLSDLTYDGPVERERYDVSFSKYFMQLDYSSKKKRNLKIFGSKHPLNYGTAIRLSYVNIDDYQITGAPALQEHNIFIEPLFYTRMHLSPNLQLQYTNGSNFGLKNNSYLKAQSLALSLGIVYNLGGKNTKR